MAELKPICELCDVEPSIVGVTQRQLAIGEKCYRKLLSKNARWTPETSKRELEEMMRMRKPLEMLVQQEDTR